MPPQSIEVKPGRAVDANCSSESASENGLHFIVARKLDEVIQAWSLVYRTYVQSGLIPTNLYEIHTVAKAVKPDTAVILARLGQLPVATLSAISDGPGGLPLDSVYSRELDELRASGRQLVEIGLFADRRTELRRSFAVVLDLMRYVTYYGLRLGNTDGIVGVHPRHAKFYCHFFSFEVVGDERTYPTVQDNPVVLLRLDWKRKCAEVPAPKGMEYFLSNPLGPEVFEQRFRFEPKEISGSIIERFLNHRASALAA